MATLESFYTEAGHLGQENENDDQLSKLPKEILFIIISNITMKEALSFSLVSHECEYVWRCVPVLIFENSHDIEENLETWEEWDIIAKERPHFVRRVNCVFEKHLGTTIDELRITSDLDHNWQSHVDKWAAFALDKQVKRLEFNFKSSWRNQYAEYPNGFISRMCGDPLNLSPAFTGCKSSLSSLCLRYVNVTDDFVDCLSRGCPLLENLCIEGSKCLTRISGSLQVKHLEVSNCYNLKRINISATKLHSFMLNSRPIELHIEDASSLFEMSIGTRISKDCFAYVFASLSEYFSQMVYLRLWIPYLLFMTVSIGDHYFVAMPNLQHLEFHVLARNNSLGELTSVMAVCPSVQKLTLKLDATNPDLKHDRPVQKWDGFPLKCLKTLEIVGYVGLPIDLELAFFVLENASMLEEVILDFFSREFPKRRDDKDKEERLVMLQMKLPQHVKLTVK